MSSHSTDLRTRLGKVRGLGSAKSGVGHWWLQRVTALALVPLTVWFVYSLITALIAPDLGRVVEWFFSPFNTFMMVALLGIACFHGKLGLQVVIEDYVHTPFAKYTLLLANTCFCFVLGVVSILAVLKLHFLGNGGM